MKFIIIFFIYIFLAVVPEFFGFHALSDFIENTPMYFMGGAIGYAFISAFLNTRGNQS